MQNIDIMLDTWGKIVQTSRDITQDDTLPPISNRFFPMRGINDYQYELLYELVKSMVFQIKPLSKI